jgi:hypothetical protein
LKLEVQEKMVIDLAAGYKTRSVVLSIPTESDIFKDYARRTSSAVILWGRGKSISRDGANRER